jgi:hypothetical protein
MYPQYNNNKKKIKGKKKGKEKVEHAMYLRPHCP